MTANIIKGLLPDGHAPSVLKQEIKDMIKSEAPAADLTKLATKEELAAVTPTAEAVAKTLGYALVVGENEPAPTTYGVRTVWLDTSNPGAFTPPAPVFSQKNKTVEIPSTKLATYKLGGAAIAAGVHRVDEPYPKAVSVTAEPAGGAKFAVGAVASWTFTYESQVIPLMTLCSRSRPICVLMTRQALRSRRTAAPRRSSSSRSTTTSWCRAARVSVSVLLPQRQAASPISSRSSRLIP